MRENINVWDMISILTWIQAVPNSPTESFTIFLVFGFDFYFGKSRLLSLHFLSNSQLECYKI